MRDKATIKRIQMYKSGKAERDKKGKITGGEYMSRDQAGNRDLTGATGRVEPDRRWFGNTRVVGASELDRFRAELSAASADPYAVVLNRKKLPLGLLRGGGGGGLADDGDGSNAGGVKRSSILECESYADVLTGKRRRKRPRMAGGATDMAALAAHAASTSTTFEEREAAPTAAETALRIDEDNGVRPERRHDLFSKGQSKRIWNELHKVIDSSDVVLCVLDARDVPGTRCRHLETYLKKHAPHKHLVFVINKCDLVPSWAARKWVALLAKERPTLAFHASMTRSFGKAALIGLLRQFAKLMADKKTISVGIVGYPNVGKSSVINTIKRKKVCKTAPIPGETKIWQYITMTRRIFLIDCPGVVYDDGADETDLVLRGVVRAERLPDPSEFVQPILDRCKREHVERVYGVSGWTTDEDFMEKVARKQGRLLKGGEPDYHQIGVNIINDFQRGKLPYFIGPPRPEKDDAAAASSSSSAAAAAAAPAGEDAPLGTVLGADEIMAVGTEKAMEVESDSEDDE